MKKKILCLIVGVTMVGGILAGCGSKEMRPATEVKPATYEELKTATETTYKDFTGGKIDMVVDANITVGEETVKGTVDLDISVDKDTAYVKIDVEGFEDTLPVDDSELYFDLENEIVYGNAGDGWYITEDSSFEDLLGEFGVSMDTESVPEVDVKEEDIKVETTKDGYVIKKSYTGTELMDMMGTGEEEDSLVMFAAIFEGLKFDIEAGFNTDKVLNSVDFTVKAESIDLGEGMALDGNLGVSVEISEINKCEVTIPQNVIDSAE